MDGFNGSFYNDSGDFAKKWKDGASFKKPKHFKTIIIGLVVFLALITLGLSSYSYVMEYWQIKEIGENFVQVFWKNITCQLATQGVGFVIFFAVIFINLIVLKKCAPLKRVDFPILSKNWPYVVVSLFLAYYLSGAISSDLYKSVLLALNGGEFGSVDPLFGQDVGYYIFLRPFLVGIAGSFKAIFLVSAIISAIIYYVLLIKDTDRTLKDMLYEEKGATAHVAINLLLYFLLVILSYKLTAEGLLFSSFGNDSLAGAGFAEAKIWMIYYKIAPFALILAVILSVLFLTKKNYKLLVLSVLLLPVIYIVTSAVSIGVEEVVVKPDERNMQSEYILNNMEATKAAFDINDVSETEYSVATNLTYSDIEEGQDAIENIRITDFRATLTAYNQLQFLRKYYSFNDVDIVPYDIEGKLTAVSLAAREMNKDNIDEAAKSYANKTFRYTHGFGAVVSPINKVTAEGQPEFMVKDIPPKTDGNIPEITQPRIYYGELTNDYVIVGPKSYELDYSEGLENFENKYDGEGGDNLSFGKRLLYAAYFKDFKMLVSGNINSESKILLNRNIMKRVKMAAPFLAFDDDPYLIIDDSGKLIWALDAYTVSENYPYSERYNGINYIRNSVKATVDAYSGEVKLYLTDKDDPIINAYAKIYPDAFEKGEIPKEIASHIRVPEFMFKAQAEMYQKYHVETAEQFYDKDDVWQIANEKYQNNEIPVEAYFTMANFDGKDELVLVQPYVLSGRHNMVGLLMMRTDKNHYGELVLYRMPKSRTIYGPMQIENKIDNDPDISREMTLWNSGGSTVIRGNLIVVPFKNSLIYVEPVYITSQNNASLPELKRVVVAYNNEVAMEPTIEGAMAKLFERHSAPSGEEIEEIPPQIMPEDVQSATDAVENAIDAYESFKTASKSNDWTQMGKYLDELDKSMEELKKQR